MNFSPQFGLQMIAFESGVMQNVETAFVAQSKVDGRSGCQRFDNIDAVFADGVMQRSIAIRILHLIQKSINQSSEEKFGIFFSYLDVDVAAEFQ